MKRKKMLISGLMILVSFLCGYALHAMLSPSPSPTVKGRVTGIGGIFFKCKQPSKVREWYHENLGLEVNQYGAVFEWYQGGDSSRKGFSQWSPFSEKTDYFSPSQKDFMINYRVEHIEALVNDLHRNGVHITDSVQSFDYGKFVHIMDLEGNKIELWEPNDIVYEKMGRDMGAKTTK